MLSVILSILLRSTSSSSHSCWVTCDLNRIREKYSRFGKIVGPGNDVDMTGCLRVGEGGSLGLPNVREGVCFAFLFCITQMCNTMWWVQHKSVTQMWWVMELWLLSVPSHTTCPKRLVPASWGLKIFSRLCVCMHLGTRSL